MLNQSTKDTIKATFLFLVPVVRSCKRIVSAIRESDARKAALVRTESIGYPVSSITVHGAHDRSSMSLRLYDAFTNAIGANNHLPDEVYEIEGMSGRATRNLLDSLVGSIEPSRYLEIGSWKGSTVISALFGNACEALCIDNWSQFGGPKHEFLKNIHNFRMKNRVKLIDEDFRSVDYCSIGKFDVFFYDGPHEEIDHYDGILIPQPALKQEYFLLVDDWNWAEVRRGTFHALSASGSTIQYAIEIRTTEDNTHTGRKQSDWHNGCFLAVIKKSPVKN